MGGTFNPIHYGHLILCEYIREDLNLDKIIFIPTGNPPHKKSSSLPSGAVRKEMTLIGTKSNPYFQVSSIETDRKGISYTIDTLREIKEIYPQDEIYFIIGADSLFDLQKWKDYKEIIKTASIIVVNRPGFDNSLIEDKIKEYIELYGGNIVSIDSPLINISSTDIRNRVKSGKSIKYLLPEEIEDYIQSKDLYK